MSPPFAVPASSSFAVIAVPDSVTTLIDIAISVPSVQVPVAVLSTTVSSSVISGSRSSKLLLLSFLLLPLSPLLVSGDREALLKTVALLFSRSSLLLRAQLQGFTRAFVFTLSELVTAPPST
ncbi:hypothetical protein BDR04DRAFT_1158799 [Suillus decipiens]|nr:hypothetical protein BDR04DRAFT_1158799 [Suillus decipiens]